MGIVLTGTGKGGTDVDTRGVKRTGRDEKACILERRETSRDGKRSDRDEIFLNLLSEMRQSRQNVSPT